MLEHDEVSLTLLELHEVLHLRTKRVEQVAIARLHLLRREQAEPLQTGDDAVTFGRVGERA